MSIVRIRRFKHVLSALAIMGALLNAWVLTVHTKSVILSGFHAKVDGLVACHSGGAKSAEAADTRDKSPASPRKTCPICSGLASLHIGVLAQPLLLVASDTRGATILATRAELAVDHRPHRTLNRGPPLLS
jgi:hypothetical protein